MAEERFQMPAAVFIILEKEGKIWLQHRANTGYRDGSYDLPSGHVERGESMYAAALREVREETGVDVPLGNLSVVHVLHNNIDSEYINVFFRAEKWIGDPSNKEPDKCDEVGWFSWSDLPHPTVPHVEIALKKVQEGILYSEAGWNT